MQTFNAYKSSMNNIFASMRKTLTLDLFTKMYKTQIKTSFNYCSSGSGQNSVIPVVCDVPE